MPNPTRDADTAIFSAILDDAPRPVAAMAKSFADGEYTPLHRHRRG